MPRSRETVKDLFAKIGYSYKIGKFNCIYNRAKEMCDSQNDMVSVRSFMMAVNALHNVEWVCWQKTKATANLLIKQDEIITCAVMQSSEGIYIGFWLYIALGEHRAGF